MRSRQMLIICMIVIFGSAVSIADNSIQEIDKNAETAFNTLKEVQYKCTGKCDSFFFQTFKTRVANSYHWTPNFTKRLYQDVKWAISNNCIKDTNLERFVDVFFW